MWTVSDSKATDLWIPGAIFLGFGGSLTFYANFHIVNLLTTYRTLVISLISGIWNAGGLNMCLIQVNKIIIITFITYYCLIAYYIFSFNCSIYIFILTYPEKFPLCA